MSRVTAAELAYLSGHGQHAEAELQAAQRDWPANGGNLSKPLVFASLTLADIALRDRRHGDAVAPAQHLLDQILTSPQPEYLADWEARAQGLLGQALTRTGQGAAAEPHLRRAVKLRQMLDDPNSPWLAQARICLAEGLIAAHKVTEAKKLLDEAAAAHAHLSALGEQYRRPLAVAQAHLVAGIR